MQDVRAVSLDLDNTLWDIHPVIVRAETALRQWLHRHVPEVARHNPPSAVARIRDDVVTRYADKLHDLTFIRRQVLAEMGRAAGAGETFVDDAFAVFDRERNTLDLYPDSVAALESLAARYPLIALTNGNADLKRIGIDHLFVGCVAARHVGAAKPHRAMFSEALRQFDCNAREVVHVGDDPTQDVVGALDAGMRAAWMNRAGARWPQHLPPATAEVRDMRALDNWLAGLP